MLWAACETSRLPCSCGLAASPAGQQLGWQQRLKPGVTPAPLSPAKLCGSEGQVGKSGALLLWMSLFTSGLFHTGNLAVTICVENLGGVQKSF